MTDIKAGDRVKVEFEGIVGSVTWEGRISVDGCDVPLDATVTVRPPEEPTGFGATVRFTDRLEGGLRTVIHIGWGRWMDSDGDLWAWAVIAAENPVVLSEGV